MKHPRHIFLILAGLGLLPVASSAQVVQSKEEGGLLWTARVGAEARVGRTDGQEIGVELPPGARLRQIEPTSSGWLAAGRLPAAEGTDLLLVSGNKDGTDLLPVPQSDSVRFRGQPALLLDRQELVGLAWAAGNGPREFEIWAASWQDEEWGPAELISPVGPGSQVAPVGTVLDDGTWLLAWTAFDGQDSEVVWSRRVEERWTRPEPLHLANDVEDLMPDIVAIEGGALAVWSWFDGNDYRLKTARWLGGAWQEPQVMGGKGSGEARLVKTRDGVLLLFQSVIPASWTVVDFDRGGNRRRTATVLEETNQRPLLLVGGADGDLLRWPSGDRRLEWRAFP